MDVVAGVASVSQLIAYSLSSAHCLQQLYSELKNFGTAYRNEEANVCLLLHVIKGISDQGVADSDPILPILLDISRLACEILHLLQPRRLWGINWTPLTRQDELKSSFTALDKKQKLLHLTVSGETLTALRTGLSRQGSFFSLDPTHTMDTPSAKFSCSNNEIEGIQEVLSNHTLPNEVDVSGNKVPGQAVHQVGNKNGLSGADVSGILQQQSLGRSESSDGQQQPKEAEGNAARGEGVILGQSTAEKLRIQRAAFPYSSFPMDGKR